MVPQKLVTIINDIVSHVRLDGLDSPERRGGALEEEMIVMGQKRKNPLSRVFVRLHSYAVKLECGAQKKTRTSTALRPPAPEAGVSTNFTIWAVSATLPLLMGRTIRSAFESVKPCFDLDSINQTLRMQKPAFAGFWRSLKIQTIYSSELVPRRRLELPRPCGHQHLKLACLPISPSGQYRQRLRRRWRALYGPPFEL